MVGRRPWWTVAVIAAAVAIAGAVRSAGAALCGELNRDGVRTLADVVRLQRAIIVPSPADCGGAGAPWIKACS
jgi:hypothetical protein